MSANLNKMISLIQNQNDFSGSILVKKDKNIIVNQSFGYANRSEQLRNTSATRYGIASGCKLITAIAICQLVQAGNISLQTKLSECVHYNFKHFDDQITVHHLLTHTSGISDYFDEEEMTDFEELWVENPMYHLRKPSDFLPLFRNKSMKFNVGERFHYNNAGYILLGLIVEQVSGIDFTTYVQRNIFDQANMKLAGYFSFDSLPTNTALGYIDNPDGTWRTNIYSLPVKGGSDGGAYVSTLDMVSLWDALMSGLLLDGDHTSNLLTPHTQVNEASYYGYGVWIKKNLDDNILKYHVMGYDPGVSFHSAFYPEFSTTVVICSNKSEGAFDMMKGIEEELA